MSEKAQKHLERYTHNLALAAEIEHLLPHAGNWVCVIQFYAVLHLINAYLIDKSNIRFNPDSTEHKERKQAMGRCPELRDAPERYRHLKDLSEYVRYDIDFDYTDEHHNWSKSRLAKIVAIVEAKLKSSFVIEYVCE